MLGYIQEKINSRQYQKAAIGSEYTWEQILKFKVKQ